MAKVDEPKKETLFKETYADAAKRIVNWAFQAWHDGKNGIEIRNTLANAISSASTSLTSDAKRELFEIIRERAEQLKRFTELVNSEVQTHTSNVGN